MVWLELCGERLLEIETEEQNGEYTVLDYADVLIELVLWKD